MDCATYPKEASERLNSTWESLYTFIEGVIGFIDPAEVLVRPTTSGFAS